MDKMDWLSKNTDNRPRCVESAKNESRKYGSISEFKRMNRSAFNFLYKRNLLDDISKENNWK